jgi:hypothetical protein
MRRTALALGLAAGAALAAACGDAFEVGSAGDDGGGSHADATIEGGGPPGAESGSPESSSSSGGHDGGGGGPDGHGGGPDGPVANDGPITIDGPVPIEGGPGCPTGLACAPPVPPGGWQGPIALELGTGTALACPPATNVVFDGGSGLVAPGATCSTCSCSAAASPTCTVSVSVFAQSDAGCAAWSAPCATGNPVSTCAALSGSCLGGAGYALATAAGSSGPCGASAPSATVPPTSWSATAVGCAPASPISCGPGTCLPSGPRFCVYMDGANVACPPAGYVTQNVYYRDVADTRGCSPCVCGQPSTTCTGGDVEVTSLSACGIAQVKIPVGGGCTTIPVGSPAGGKYYTEMVQGTSTVASGTCPASGGQPAGAAAGASPITVCCAP